MRNSSLVFLFGLAAFLPFTFSAAAQTGPQSSALPPPGVPGPAPASAAPEVSASYTISQLGHPVGSGYFRIVPMQAGYQSTSTVRVSMEGLQYALSKTEQLDAAHHLDHLLLSATVNNQAVNVTCKPDASRFLLNISANGRSATTPLAGHAAAVFLADFDPGALQTLLILAEAQNGRDLWAIIPKQSGSIAAIQLATLPDEHGALDGQPVTVHHLLATINQAATDLFTGPRNELLQAELPQEGFSVIHKGFVLTPPTRPGAAPQE